MYSVLNGFDQKKNGDDFTCKGLNEQPLVET
jgi:hypothetical protein